MRGVIFVLKQLILIIALGAALFVSAAAKAETAYATLYGDLLSTYTFSGTRDGVPTTLVNYRAWRDDLRHRQAMKRLLSVDPDKLTSKPEKLAFWINAYNLLTIDLIVRNPGVESIKSLGSLFQSPWTRHKWSIHGKEYTLDEIENEFLRPLGDPRIHMAINCASISCPNLRREPYKANKIDEQLNDQVRQFLSNAHKGMAFDGDALTLSKIFDWFSADFGGKNGVVTFIRSHAPDLPAGTEIRGYLPYNWNLNGTWQPE